MIKSPPDLLYSHGSLTALLEKKAGRPVRVQILHECYQVIDFKTKKLLGLPIHRPAVAWVREVELFGDDDVAWVRAKSVFPLTSLVGNAKRLRHLKRTPIGYVMFKKNHRLPHTRTYFFDEYWGRNTIYDWHGRHILVQEIFLGD
ncbi:MAG: chorismate lyase [Moraxella sp.]|nr:chorismate lyase [Moraxella sp.]